MGLVEKNVRFLPPMGLVDEKFINEALPVLLRVPIKLGRPLRKGLLKEACKAQKLGRAC